MNKYEKLLNDTMGEVKEVPIKNNQLDKNHLPLAYSTLKLFNALPVNTQKKKNPTKEITEITINNGFVFSPQVFANYPEQELIEMLALISETVGLSPSQMNASFHKTWKKVRDAPMEQLVFEQMTHYMTTYGYARMGVFDERTVYIPNEKLEVPKLEGDVRLTVINGFTKKQLKEKLVQLLASGIALKSTDEVIAVATYCGFDKNDLENVKNKEVRVRLIIDLDITPSDPLEFLRTVIFKTTGKTMIITDKKTIESIKEHEDNDVRKLFVEYDKEFGYKRLAEIFLRFKRLFLAFKEQDKMPRHINKISHLAKRYHKTMPQSLLNNVTGILKNNGLIDEKELNKELKEVNIFRKIRLLHALKYRMAQPENIVYKIRNGKSHPAEMSFDNVRGATKVAAIVLESIAKDLKHLKGKKLFIPENMKYSLPATEKQFSGNIPSGSYIEIAKDMIFGVHWTDVENDTVDLDLSLISLEHGKMGWDSSYRSDDSAILFSGDNTSAPKPKGASELYYVSQAHDDVMLVNLNHYNRHSYLFGNDGKETPIPFTIIVGEEHTNRSSFAENRDYTIDPNNVKCTVKTEIDTDQKIIGLIMTKNGVCKFYFSETGFGAGRTSRNSGDSEIAREYLVTYVSNMIYLNDILKLVGAKIVDKIEKGVIDLSPENLQKDTFINLLTNHNE